ncbi:MAG: VanZ family protein [Erysipelotrichaceae bacterium]|nr:VanZ family protein [Erysipelotrichaceae bacterium]
MFTLISQILKDFLAMFYQYGAITIICALLIIIVWKEAEDTSFKTIGQNLIQQFKEKKWQRRFLLVIYVVLILQCTIFNRDFNTNPLENVLGNWWIIKDGSINYELFENILIYMPLYPLLAMNGITKAISRPKKYKGIWIPFCLSLVIELIQLFFRIDLFQISTIVFNTLGGFIGALIYDYLKLALNNKVKEIGND